MRGHFTDILALSTLARRACLRSLLPALLHRVSILSPCHARENVDLNLDIYSTRPERVCSRSPHSQLEALVKGNNHLQTIRQTDLFQLKFLSFGKLSPDGKYAAYVISHVDPKEEEEHSAIWLIDLETGESRQLTNGLTRDSSPAWSPDSKQIAFISARNEKSQFLIFLEC